MAGYEEIQNRNIIAKLWKNGVAINLSNGTPNAIAHSVFVY